MISANPDTDWLIKQAQRFESLATSSQTFDDEDMVEFFNAELQSVVTPIIQSVNEEFGVMSIDYDLSQMQWPYTIRIPSQATGARLRNVQLVNNLGYITNYPRISPEIAGAQGFYIRNNEIHFYPVAPSTWGGILRVTYFRRSNQLVQTIKTGRVVDSDPISGLVSLDNNPDGEGWVPGAAVDIIIGTSPFDFRARDVMLLDINGAVLQVPLDVAATLQEGDYFALAGQTPVPQFVPLEAMHLVAQLGAARCLQSLGDTEGFTLASAKAEQMRLHLINLISDRVEGQPKKIHSRRRFGRYYGFGS